ncbi:alpha/beta hydrolase [Candidatus Pacearchaeota archaeon]|nr:alpha/beta hydrolase [Candidatus Pacearchaeota archaeon]
MKRRTFLKSAGAIAIAHSLNCIGTIENCVIAKEPFEEYTPGAKSLDFILSHGLRGSHKDLEPIKTRIREEGYGTLVWDYPDYADNIEDLVLRAGEFKEKYQIQNPVFGGVSLGGMVSFGAAAKYDCAGLLIINSAHRGTPAFSNVLKSEALRRKDCTRHPAKISALVELCGSLIGYEPPIQNINAPVIYISSEKDEIFPREEVEYTISHLTCDYSWTELKNSGHAIYEDRIEEILNLITEQVRKVFGAR